jgi:pimeloyl-ACP methyl ester carboxylesterase
MKTENSLTLSDGRKLSYAEFGKPDGYPVFYFHGSPSSRLEPLLIGDDVIRQSGLRVIAPDRPGIGQSDFQTNRGVSDWPKDVIFLADAVGFNKFAVLGISGGGVYAAVCAAKIPDRLRSAVIVSGAWRMDWPEALNNLHFPNSLFWNLASKAPFLLPFMLKMMSVSPEGERGREQMLAQLKKSLHASDYDVLTQPGRMDAYLQVLGETMYQGTKGPDWDARLFVREFDFSLSEIRLPLKVFHGEQDMNVPLPLVRRTMRMLPGAQLMTFPGEAHLSTYCNHFDEIANALVFK